MDRVHSGTGVFYQAMPAIGTNGKNIMKLIPVQMVNGRFVQTQTSKPKTSPAPQKEVTFSAASAIAEIARKEASSQQRMEKQVSLLNVFPNQVASALGSSANQQPAVKVIPPALNLLSSVRLPFQLPVTVKSPVLPRGQCLQIPPTAQVQRVPASQLPPRVKEQIFTSSTGCPASGSNSVVYVSPVTTVVQAEPSGSASLRLPSQTSHPASPHLKLIPKVSQRPNSPIRWVIEEVDNATADNLRCPLSPSVTSEIIQSVTERENRRRGTVCPPGQRDVRGQENALVMCNGKVFFVANKSSSSVNSSTTPPPPPYRPPLPPPPPPQHPQESAAPTTKPNLRPPSEVIDLCDDEDDPQQASSSLTSSVSHPDEDNVIFVSYIPPKSESLPVPQAGVVDRTTSSSSVGRVDVSAQRGGDGEQESPTRRESHDGGPDPGSRSAATQLDSMEVDGASPADRNTPGERPQTEEQKGSAQPAVFEWTSPVPRLRQTSDVLLRKMFGITADVKICLQKIDEATAGCVSAHLLHESSWVEEETPKRSFSLDMCRQEDRGVCSSIEAGVKTLSEHQPSASLHTRMTPLKSSHFKLNSEAASAWKESCCSGQSSHARMCHAEPDPVLGYVEPIDEDFPDENDIPKSQSSPNHPQTCADMSSNTRRLGRTRKRTMCPCCVPAALHPAVKVSGRSEEPETTTAEQTGKKPGRIRAPRKDGRTSGRIGCLEARNRQKCKMHEALSTCQRRHDKTERLRRLLDEEETEKSGIS